MPYDERRIEAVAMKAEEMARNAPMGVVGVDALGAACGMKPEEIRELLEYLRQRGWVSPNYSHEPPDFTLTEVGRQGIAELKNPRPVRWLNKNPGVKGVLGGIIGGVLTFLAIAAVKRLLHLP